jgi:HEAT repeat protein
MGMSRKKAVPSIEDDFCEALTEPSRVRRRNKFKKALFRFRDESVADPQLVGYLLNGLDTADDYVAEQIAEEDLPRFGRAIIPRLQQSLNLQGTRADGLRLTALVKIDPSQGRKLCETALQQGSDVVQGHAMKALTELDRKKAKEVALECLSNQKLGVRFKNTALAALTGSRRDQALELLLAALPHPRLVWSAHFALKKSPNPKLTARLQARLASLVSEIEAEAARSVPIKGKSSYLWHLMALLIDRPEPEGLAAVIRLMDHPLEDIRGSACSTVWHHCNNHALAGTRCIPELAKALKYADPRARDAAVNVLGCGGARAGAAVPALVDVLRTDPDYGMRRRTAEALGRIGTPAKAVVPALVAALRDESPWVRRQAVESLGWVRPLPRQVIPLLVKMLEDLDINVTGDIPAALNKIAPLRVVLPILIETLGHKHPGTRGCAANVVGELGPHAREAIPALIDLLQDTDGWVRWRAAAALGNMGVRARAAVPALCQLLTASSDPWHTRYARETAAEALGKIGPAAQAAIPALSAFRRDKNKAMRDAVAHALTAIQGPG